MPVEKVGSRRESGTPLLHTIRQTAEIVAIKDREIQRTIGEGLQFENLNPNTIRVTAGTVDEIRIARNSLEKAGWLVATPTHSSGEVRVLEAERPPKKGPTERGRLVNVLV